MVEHVCSKKQFQAGLASGILGLSLCSLNACRVEAPALPLEQKIYQIKWSPDGLSLAFAYRTGRTSLLDYSIYTIKTDGSDLKEIIQVQNQEIPYFLLQWLQIDQLLVGDYWHLYQMDFTGKTKLIFSLEKTSPTDPRISPDSTCSLYDRQKIIINRVTNPPLLLNIVSQQADNYRPVEFVPPHPYTGTQPYPGEISCNSFGQSVYLDSVAYDVSKHTEHHIFATASLESESAKAKDIQVFDPIKALPQEEIGKANFHALGWKNDHIFLFAFENSVKNPLLSAYEYNTITKEIEKNNEIFILGDYSPDFQKVAYVSSYKDGTYLTISRTDGTDVQHLLKIQTLPKGDMPL